MTDIVDLEARVAELRSAFDQSFARPTDDVSIEQENVLTIRAGGARYAVRLREIDGIVARRKVTSVPAAAPHLLGVAGIRGRIVPVFDLGSILGQASPLDAPGWLMLCGREEPVALGFSELDAYVRVPSSSFHADAAPSSVNGKITEVVQTDAGILFVINVPLVMASLRDRASQARRPQEK